MSRIAIIPARGGSKRIPRKNIKDFLGKPIISYSIEAAINSSLFDEVMVSTDDSEIANIAKRYGAKVPFLRSRKNADDYATTIEVISEVLEGYAAIGKSFDLICCLYPTAPLIKKQHLKDGLHALQKNNYDAVIPVIPFSYPIWRGFRLKDGNKKGAVEMIWPEYLTSRTQDLEVAYHDAGQWYWLQSKNKLATLFPENTGAVILSEQEVQDIDNDTDWKLAEMKYKILYESGTNTNKS